MEQYLTPIDVGISFLIGTIFGIALCWLEYGVERALQRKRWNNLADRVTTQELEIEQWQTRYVDLTRASTTQKPTES